VHKNSAKVTWAAPETDGGAKIIGYRLEIKSEKLESWVTVSKETITTTEYTLTSPTIKVD
jgi:hypothetical protein